MDWLSVFICFFIWHFIVFNKLFNNHLAYSVDFTICKKMAVKI